jgi:hypothetical protein
VSLFFVHFLSPATRNEPKKRRQRGEGFASLNISPSLETPPLSAMPTKREAYFNLVKFCFKINALAGFNTLSRGSDSGGFF